MKTKFLATGVVLSLLMTFPTSYSASASSICRKASSASVSTSDQTLSVGDTLTVTFKGIGGGCQSGHFKVVSSSTGDLNTQGFISGLISNLVLDSNPSGVEGNFERVTFTHQVTSSEAGKFLQYFFVTTSGVKVRSVVVMVLGNS